MSEVVNELILSEAAPAAIRLRKRRRFHAMAIFVAVSVAIAAWWCFGPAAAIDFPGTVSIIDAGHGHRVIAAASSAASGDGMYVDDDGVTFGEFRSQHWPSVTSTRAPDVGSADLFYVYVNRNLLVSGQGRALLQSRSGELLLREPDGRIDNIRIRFRGDAQTKQIRVFDAHWNGDELVLLVSEQRNFRPHQPWRLKYRISVDGDRDRTLLPTEAEQLTADDMYWATLRHGTNDWAAFQLANVNSLNAGQTLRTSDGYEATLPGTMNLPATAFLPYHDAILLDARDELIALRVPDGQDGFEIVSLPLNGQVEAREPLLLPIENMNTWLDGTTSDGKYALVRSFGNDNTFLWATGVLPPLVRWKTRDCLVLIDLDQWAVVATFAHNNHTFSSPVRAIGGSTFSHDDRHVLVPSGRRLFTVDIQKWIDACR